MYRLTKVTPRGSETQAIIETRNWAIGRLIQIDGKALTPERQRKSITIDSATSTTDFRRMPNDLTPEQGLARLLAEGETTLRRYGNRLTQSISRRSD